MKDGLIEALRRVLPLDQVHTGIAERGLYGRDASNMAGRTDVVCLATSTSDVQRILEVCHRFDAPFVARGSGTGLAGGATPLDGAVVVSTAKMNRILSIDVAQRMAWVEPGVLNLDLTRQVFADGLHFAPDPSSQQSCTIGGNVANNSGGPHCLADGVTSQHIIGMEVVLSDGTIAVFNAETPDSDGFDLRGAFIGSEGMFGIATKICVRLTPNPPAVRTLLMDFATVEHGTDTVSAIIAAGMVPAALEMMDQLCLQAVEAYVGAGLPTDAAVALLVEVAGAPHQVEADVARICDIGVDHEARTIRVAADEAERALLWKARKNAFGAIARIKPNYYLHDTVVPRHRLTEVLSEVYAIAARYELQVLNVFHAGDGNLHPLLIFDRREPGIMERVHAAGEDIIRVSIAAGGVLSGEHGIGLEKRNFMSLMFSESDLDAQQRMRECFDPWGRANPLKVLPSPASCGDAHHSEVGMWI